MGDTNDLAMMLDAKIPIVVIESPDEPRVLDFLARFAIDRSVGYYEWTVTRGLKRVGFAIDVDGGNPLTEPDDVLAHILATKGPALYALCDFHPYLSGEPKTIRHLKDIALDYERCQSTIVLVSPKIELPSELSRLTASFNFRLPNDDELMALVRKQAKQWSDLHAGKKVKTDQATLGKLVANLRGVTHADAQLLIRHAVFADGAITESDIPELNKLKFELLDAEGVLRFDYDTATFKNVAGLDNLKSWLQLRKNAFVDASIEDRPKGILLLGVQGGGKSLAAKAVAGYWGIPLLRLDFGSLYNKFFGETERNLRNSLRQAELMAPCVLWMDEIEKGVATGTSDNATSQRVLGTLLTWMAENDRQVFIVATSNDISKLPPELVRKGRLDEIFFVDLPDQAVRREIFRIHLEKRDMEPGAFDLGRLAAESDGFTGAEIEETIVSARYTQDRVTTDDLVAAMDRTYPISQLRAESIDALRHWAKGRTVAA